MKGGERGVLSDDAAPGGEAVLLLGVPSGVDAREYAQAKPLDLQGTQRIAQGAARYRVGSVGRAGAGALGRQRSRARGSAFGACGLLCGPRGRVLGSVNGLAALFAAGCGGGGVVAAGTGVAYWGAVALAAAPLALLQ